MSKASGEKFAMGDRRARLVTGTAILTVLVAGLWASAAFSDEGGGIAPLEENDGWLNYVDYFIGDADGVLQGGVEGVVEIDEIRQRLLADLQGAEERIDAAINQLEDEDIEEALIAAADRGVRVRVVADEHYEDSGQFDALVDHDDISVVFGDGELSYLPEPNLSPILSFCDANFTNHDDHINCTQADGGLPENSDRVIDRPSHYNSMSHTFFVLDQTYLWNISAPMTSEQRVWPAFRAMSEELVNSFEREFRQMHGGVFSTTLSVYNGPLKSITHQHPLRLTNRGKLRVRFNPQERLVKNVIDETYRARGSVYVMTENLTNPDLIAALRYKVERDFDVKVLVGQGQAPTLMSQVEGLGAVQAPEEMGRLPTMVLINAAEDRNGDQQPRMVQILSHELWRAQPFEVLHEITEQGTPARNVNHDKVRFYPSDTFADGVMWELVESGTGWNNPEVEPFVQLWEEMWAEANQ